MQLEPDLDISGFGPLEHTIAVALQDYGMYLADIGGGVSLYAVNPLSFAEDPYPALGLTADVDGVHDLSDLTIADFRVLDFGPQQNNLTDGRCDENDPRFEYPAE